jgi:hypothetical protein
MFWGLSVVSLQLDCAPARLETWLPNKVVGHYWPRRLLNPGHGSQNICQTLFRNDVQTLGGFAGRSVQQRESLRVFGVNCIILGRVTVDVDRLTWVDVDG